MNSGVMCYVYDGAILEGSDEPAIISSSCGELGVGLYTNLVYGENGAITSLDKVEAGSACDNDKEFTVIADEGNLQAFKSGDDKSFRFDGIWYPLANEYTMYGFQDEDWFEYTFSEMIEDDLEGAVIYLVLDDECNEDDAYEAISVLVQFPS